MVFFAVFVGVAGLVASIFALWWVFNLDGESDRNRRKAADHGAAIGSLNNSVLELLEIATKLAARLDSIAEAHRRALNIQASRIDALDGRLADLGFNFGLHRDAQNAQAGQLGEVRDRLDVMEDSRPCWYGIKVKGGWVTRSNGIPIHVPSPGVAEAMVSDWMRAPELHYSIERFPESELIPCDE